MLLGLGALNALRAASLALRLARFLVVPRAAHALRSREDIDLSGNQFTFDPV